MARGKAAERAAKADAQDREDERTERIDGPDAVGHNKPNELTEDERRVLTYTHKRTLDSIEEKLKAVKAEKSQAESLAKAELGKEVIADIKALRLLEMPKGNEAMQADLQRMARLARWANAPVGYQFTLGVAPSEEERAFELGKTAGLQGEPKSSPFHHTLPQHDKWCKGWDAGSEINLSNFREKLLKANAKNNGEADGDDDQMDLAERGDLPPTAEMSKIDQAAAGDQRE